MKWQVYFGQNLVCEESRSEGKGVIVKVGDPVYVHKVVSSPANAAAWTLSSIKFVLPAVLWAIKYGL